MLHHKNKIAIFGLFVLICATGAGELLAQGGYAGAFLRMGAASRSEAMGRAYTAVHGNAESVYYNPAAAPMMQNRMIDLSWRSLNLDRNYAFVGFATALQPGGDKGGAFRGGLSLSWIHASVSDIEGRDFDGEQFDTFSSSENAFNFTFALQPHPRVNAGVSAHIISNRFPGLGDDGEATISSRNVALDAGVLVTAMPGVWIGAVIKNLNGENTWDSSSLFDQGSSTADKYPRIWRLGIATDRLYENLTVAFDMEGADKYDPRYFVGADYQARKDIHLRAGLRDGEPTFGAGYAFSIGKRQSLLHYAFAAQPAEVAEDHIFSWTFIF